MHPSNQKRSETHCMFGWSIYYRQLTVVTVDDWFALSKYYSSQPPIDNPVSLRRLPLIIQWAQEVGPKIKGTHANHVPSLVDLTLRLEQNGRHAVDVM